MIWQNLILGFVFSFIGSIPPGTINLSVIQLSLRQHVGAAFRMALAAAMIEFVYAAIAIKFQIFITNTPGVQENFKLISAAVLILLGVVNLIPSRKKPSKKPLPLTTSGFRKGVLISLANPLAMPFWIGVTAYLQSNEWVNFEEVTIWSYVCGISLGTIALLSVFALTGYRTARYVSQDNKYIKIIPGVVLLSLGLYSLVQLYIF